MVGSGLVGLFADFKVSGATNIYGEPINGAFYGNAKQLAYQCAGVTVASVFSAIGTTIIFWFIWALARVLNDTIAVHHEEHSDKANVRMELAEAFARKSLVSLDPPPFACCSTAKSPTRRPRSRTRRSPRRSRARSTSPSSSRRALPPRAALACALSRARRPSSSLRRPARPPRRLPSRAACCRKWSNRAAAIAHMCGAASCCQQSAACAQARLLASASCAHDK